MQLQGSNPSFREGHQDHEQCHLQDIQKHLWLSLHAQMSDANRGEAARCMDIARAALAASDFAKAHRFSGWQCCR